jgi:prevent-host-death family protein
MGVSISKIRDNLADALNRVAYAGERIVLERRGRGVAAIVSMEDLQVLEDLDTQADIKAAKKVRKEKGGITLKDYKKKHGL